MRLLKEIPEVEAKVKAGTLTLSALSQAQTFFRQEKEKIKGTKDKIEILLALENKSRIEVQRELVSRSSNPVRLVPERVRPVSDTHSEIRILIEAGLLKEIEELRNLVSHTKPNAGIKDLIAFAVSRTLQELRPKAPKVNVVQVHKHKTSARGPTRYIAQETKRQVWQRDQGQCTFRDPLSGRNCGSKKSLEFDHIIPFARSGSNSSENLRLRCQAHNQLAAIQSFGVRKISQFIPRIS